MTDLTPLSEALSAVPPFSALPDDERSLLLQRLPRRRYPARAVIAGTGTDESGLYVLLTGKAKVTMTDAQGRQVTLASVRPGDLLCKEMELFGASSGALMAIATEACEVLYVNKSELTACVSAHPRAALLLIAELAKHLRNAYEKIASFAFDDVRTRVAHTLLDCATLEGKMWTVGIGSEELARIVGASREMISRVLRNMQTSGLVRRLGRRIAISDRNALLKEYGGGLPEPGRLEGQARSRPKRERTTPQLTGRGSGVSCR
jgi:CRP/FNR family transcriptional regulator, cyclic AMP receptor protein